MSFILDALKKSESDRQRQSGPALFEVKVAPPRTRLPLWAIAIAALLVVNLAIVMWRLMRHPARAGATSAETPAAAAAPPVGASAIVGTAAPAPVPPPLAASPASAPAAVAGAPAPAPVPLPATSGATAAPAAAAQAGVPGATVDANPEDYAPAEEPAASSLGGHVRRGTASGVPLYQDAATTPGTPIPQLRLDLHVFAARPQDRFVMINMHKLREGDTLPEGVRVDSITPEGAVLSYNGSRFLLPRD
jgi:general secretion pathway protein B